MLLPINGSPGGEGSTGGEWSGSPPHSLELENLTRRRLGGEVQEESGNNGLDLELQEINFHCDPLENLSPNQRYVNLNLNFDCDPLENLSQLSI